MAAGMPAGPSACWAKQGNASAAAPQIQSLVMSQPLSNDPFEPGWRPNNPPPAPPLGRPTTRIHCHHKYISTLSLWLLAITITLELAAAAGGSKEEPLVLLEERETSPLDKSATKVLLARHEDGADASEARLWARHKNGGCSYGGRRTSRCPTGSECKAGHACFVNPPPCRTAGQLCGAHATCCGALQCADTGAHPVCEPPGCAQSLAKVLVVGADSSPKLADVKAKLFATGAFTTVDTFRADTGTPTLAYLQGYDVVLAFSNANFNNATLMGDNLADYRDGGGRVVIAAMATSTYALVEGRWLSGNYSLIAPYNSIDTTAQLGPLTFVEPTNPLLNGVTSLTANNAHRNPNPSKMAVCPWPRGMTAPR